MSRPARFVDHRAVVRASIQEIDDIVRLANEQSDLVVQAYMMRLATIRLSGFIEQAVGAMIRGYLSEHTSYRVLKFSTRQVGRIANLNPAKLEQLVGAFDDEWMKALTQFLGEDENRQTLGNLIDARHQLAHGNTTRMSPALLNDYQRVATQTIDLLFDLFLPLREAPTPA